jgi:hypothetical protein
VLFLCPAILYCYCVPRSLLCPAATVLFLCPAILYCYCVPQSSLCPATTVLFLCPAILYCYCVPQSSLCLAATVLFLCPAMYIVLLLCPTVVILSRRICVLLMPLCDRYCRCISLLTWFPEITIVLYVVIVVYY